jgi:hypothetical protein
MTNGVTNDITMFNLDNFMAPPTPTSAGPHPITQPIPKSHSPDSSSSNYSKPSSQAHTPNTPVSARAQNLMMQYHDYTEHQTSSNVKSVADDGHHYFDCPKVWERIVMHPRFDEVDVEALCAELNAKVRIVSFYCGSLTDFSVWRGADRVLIVMIWRLRLIRLLMRLLQGIEVIWEFVCGSVFLEYDFL